MLIIISKSPFVGNYASIIDVARRTVREKKVGILHIQDACIALTSDKYFKKLADAKLDVYVLKADCEDRGILNKIKKEVKMVDYNGWVKLVMEEYTGIVSWI